MVRARRRKGHGVSINEGGGHERIGESQVNCAGSVASGAGQAGVDARGV